MLKIVYEGENYNYGNAGKQPYDINTEIKVIEDATVTEAVEAFVKVLQIATYHIDRETMLNAVNEVFDEIEY